MLIKAGDFKLDANHYTVDDGNFCLYANGIQIACPEQKRVRFNHLTFRFIDGYWVTKVNQSYTVQIRGKQFKTQMRRNKKTKKMFVKI
jgi:hypothetical protein